MKRTRIILIGLLIVGVVLLGAGVWLKIDFDNKISIPNEQPAVFMQNDRIMAGTSTSLFIYPDGTVIYAKETGLRLGKPSMAWKKGKIRREDLDALIAYSNQANFKALNDIYNFTGKNESGGSYARSDAMLTISVNYGGLTKIVHANGYISNDNDASFIRLPDPFNQVYQRLMLIADTSTEPI